MLAAKLIIDPAFARYALQSLSEREFLFLVSLRAYCPRLPYKLKIAEVVHLDGSCNKDITYRLMARLKDKGWIQTDSLGTTGTEIVWIASTAEEHESRGRKLVHSRAIARKLRCA